MERKKLILRMTHDKNKAARKGNVKEAADLCNQLGETLAEEGDYESALDIHREELELCESVEDVIGAGIANRRIGECYAEMERFDKAIKHQLVHLQHAERAGSLLEKQRALATLGRTQLQRAESLECDGKYLESAEKYFEMSLKVCDQIDGVDDSEIALMKVRLRTNMGVLKGLQGNNKQGSRNFDVAISMATQYSLNEEQLRALHLKCDSEIRDNSLGLSDSLTNGLRLARVLKDKQQEFQFSQLKTQFLIDRGNFCDAYQTLKAAKSFKYFDNKDSKLLRKLSTLVKHSKLVSGGSASDRVKLGSYERLGDISSSLGLYDKSLSYYRHQLRIAEKLRVSKAEMRAVYVSVAATYSDLGDYDKAIAFYRKELEYHADKDNAEKCKTLLCVAACEEAACVCNDDVMETYRRAEEFATAAGDTKTLLKCLKALLAYKESDPLNDCDELRERLDDMADGDVDDVSVNGSSVYSEDVDESSEDSEDEVGTVRRTVVGKLKRNEKGETALHLAAIQGNYKAVARLLERRHPVNCRDNSGWTPLHEAANHGFPDVVRLLVERGADVDDRGGPDTGGVTPLIDAASNGNLDVLEFLIHRAGAAVGLRDARGATALRCLREWRSRNDGELDEGRRSQCAQLENDLRELASRDVGAVARQSDATLRVARQPVATPAVAKQPCGASSRQSVRWRSALLSDDDSSQDRVVSPPGRSGYLSDSPVGQSDGTERVDSQDIDAPGFGESVYRDAMRSLGSKAVQDDVTDVETVEDDVTEGLVSEREYECVGVKDWLVEDCGYGNPAGVANPFHNPLRRNQGDVICVSKSTKRLNSSPQSKSSKRARPESVPVPVHIDDDSSRFGWTDKLPVSKQSSSLARKRRLKQTKLNLLLSPKSPSLIPAPNENFQFETIKDTSSVCMSKEVGPSRPPPFRVKVSVADKLLVVPVPEGTNFRDLESDVSRRYEAMYGQRPTVRLRASDGGVFLPEDDVTATVSRDETLRGAVAGWDVRPLPVRYRQRCREVGVEPNRRAAKLLEKSSGSAVLSLRNLGLQANGNHYVSLLKSIEHEVSLTTLSLHGNQIGDHHMYCLGETLKTLINLRHLDVSVNSITAQGLRTLATSFVDSGLSNNLLDFNISFNPLTDLSVKPLSTIVRNSTNLQSLNLSHCGLSQQFFHTGRQEFNEAFHWLTQLCELDVSSNQWGATGIELWLNALRSETLNSLNLSNPGVTTSTALRLVQHIAAFLSNQSGFHLSQIHLANCCLTPEGLVILAAVMPPSVRLLNIDANPQIDCDSLVALFTNSNIKPPDWQYLSAARCNLGELTGELVHLLTNSMALVHLDLQGNNLSDKNWESLRNAV